MVRELYCLGLDPVSVIFKLCGLGKLLKHSVPKIPGDKTGIIIIPRA